MSTGRLHIAAALVLGSPFVPLLFQGEEWGASTPFQYFTDHRDPELASSVTSGRHREFAGFGGQDDVPDPQARETFERSKLRWDELEEEPYRSLLDCHRIPSPSSRIVTDGGPRRQGARSRPRRLGVDAQGALQVRWKRAQERENAALSGIAGNEGGTRQLGAGPSPAELYG